MSVQPDPITSLPALSASALSKVKTNEQYLLESVVRSAHLRDGFGRIDGSAARRDLRTVALNNFQIYLEDYHTAGYRASQSMHDLISDEICATLTTVCSLCLPASDVEDEVKSSIQGWIRQQHKIARLASLQKFEDEVLRVANPPVQSPPTLRQKSAPKSLEPNPVLLDGKETVNRKQAAEALGISTRTLDRWVEDDKVTPVGAGGRKRFKTRDLKLLLTQKAKDK